MRQGTQAVEDEAPATREVAAADARHLGRRIRELRARRGWTQDALAERAGVSKAMLSKVERGENNPTLVVAARIAGALGLTMSQLIGADERRRALRLPKEQRVTFLDPATGIERRQFPAFGSSAVDIVQVIMPAGSSSGDLAPHLTPTEHYLLVEQGVVRVTIGDEIYDLAAGDALYFVGDVPHRFDNIGEDEARYIGVGHGHR
ncbi:MAG TPA: XRE family transcriptional regulator [Chloroflexota bacterium]|jgi:transcriptional regulator with XRE-family HTH domain|nr:XRE family transcriptional regulator [Chloroflexota bacterium]